MIIIKYGVFNVLNDNISEITINKSYNVRPMAFVSDAFIFQWFWNNMYIVLVLMLVMHVCNMFFIYKICEKIGIKLSGFCLVLFVLSPILIEALYWVSASTRIVFSLFLSLASIYLLLKSFDEKSKKKRVILLISSIILNLICVGYYEQTIALNLFLFAFVMICIKKYKYILIPLISTTWIGIWYVYFMVNGQMQSRGALNLSGIFTTSMECIKKIIINYKNAYSNFIYSFGFGREAILSSFVSIAVFALMAVFIYYIYKNKCNKNDNTAVWKKLILGGIIFITPFLPFIVLKTEYIAVRNMFIPTLGLAIIIEVLLDLVLKLIKSEMTWNIIKTSIISFIMFLFIISNIDGCNNYRKVNAIDNKVASQIIQNVNDEVFDGQGSISINYDATKLATYKNLSNYVESVVESDWAMIGKLEVLLRKIDIGTIYINSNQEEADVALYFDDEMNLKNIEEK